MADSPLITGVEAFGSWRTSSQGPPLKTWSVGDEFAHIEIGPGRVLLIGGAPGSGKTALLLQWAFNALGLASFRD